MSGRYSLGTPRKGVSWRREERLGRRGDDTGAAGHIHGSCFPAAEPWGTRARQIPVCFRHAYLTGARSWMARAEPGTWPETLRITR